MTQSAMTELAIHLFTSITANYIPKARVLAHSAKQFHPNAQFHLVLCDLIPDSIVLENEPFDSIITVEELGIPHLHAWIFKHAIVEMCTGVKGLAFQTILDRYNAEKVFFFDPDMVILSPLDSLLEQLDNYSILLTPHQTVPEATEDAIIDNEICSLKHGVFNLGFLGIRNSEQGKEFIQWWRDRCLDYCYDDIPRGLFTDQKWVDLTPAFFSDYYVLRDPIYNVATWNLSHRQATGSLAEGIYINGEPICFYHFSGFDSGAQEVMLNKYGGKSPVLFELRQWYLQECDRFDQAKLGKHPCHYATFDNGEKITKDQRLLYRYRKDLQEIYPNPFSTFNPQQSYYHWFQNHSAKDYIPGRYNYFQNTDDALIAAQNEIEELKTWIKAMESSKFWKLRQAWFWLKEKPKQIYRLLKNNPSQTQSIYENSKEIEL